VRPEGSNTYPKNWPCGIDPASSSQLVTPCLSPNVFREGRHARNASLYN
jgi:hypothetical protein